ncbi:MAG: sulfatase [Planctomycetota bacterium]
MNTSNTITFFLVAISCSSIFANNGVPEVQRQPNIVLILADDLGWSDTTLYGNTSYYQTPNIERLSKRGMTFRRAYADSPLCSPTRSAILTGLSPARTGFTAPNGHLGTVQLKARPGKQASPTAKSVPVNTVTRLDPKYFTLGEALKAAGYQTGHFGKWHLGIEPYSPLENGFDVDLPHHHGPGPAGGFVAPWSYLDFDPQTPNEHIEDRMAQEAVAFMEANRDKPFFLNYWMFSVHAPFDAKKELINKYRKQVDPKSPQRCPTYAAMIESMDDAVGTLLDTIDRLGIAEDTIIIFASDNGGNMYNWVDGTTPTSNTPLKGGKATMYEGGIRTPFSIVWPNHTATNSRSDEVIQTADIYPTILEMIDLKPQANQSFDGISIVPALKGKSLKRDAIFTFFPHSPTIPDWLPPAVSVHSGDWKLIRLFHEGQNGDHRWKLFNLADDIGETNNLANEKPDLVNKLDAKISGFLRRTKAVVPTVNPNFDPSKYNLANEGKAELKGKPQAVAKAGKQVFGWNSGGTGSLQPGDGKLIVNSTGGDPYLTYDFERPLPAGKHTLKLTFSSDSDGFGKLFWAHKLSKPKFQLGRDIEFDVVHDGKQNTFSVTFDSKNPLTAIRIDPSRGKGKIVISAAELFSSEDKSLYRWEFR